MKEILQFLFDHKTLSRDDAKMILTNIAQGKYNDPEIASFISVYLMRSITTDELSGFRDALLDLCIPVELNDFNTIDVCGTGGDEKNTFNISTLAAFIIAGAGEYVAKHGNYSVSSSCGSSNVLEYYGYKFTNDTEALKKQIDEAGICFLHAPLFNPAMKNVAPVRKSLRVKTFFNMLGPMVNPAFPKNQMIGVYSLEVARLYNYIYQDTDKSFCIVHSLDGYDEISLTGSFRVLSRDTEQIIQPADIGLEELDESSIYGGTSVGEASKIFLDVLEGKGTKQQNQVVIANAAYGIKTLNPEKSIEQCIESAERSLYDRKALESFKHLTTI